MAQFDTIAEKAVSLVKDLAELEVLTFRGDLSSAVDTNGAIDWTKLNAKTTGTLNLALATNIKLDGDVQMFVADKIPEQWILDAHLSAVKSSLEMRKSMVELGLGLLKR